MCFVVALPSCVPASGSPRQREVTSVRVRNASVKRQEHREANYFFNLLHIRNIIYTPSRIVKSKSCKDPPHSAEKLLLVHQKFIHTRYPTRLIHSINIKFLLWPRSGLVSTLKMSLTASELCTGTVIKSHAASGSQHELVEP